MKYGNRKIEKEKLKEDLFNSHYQTKEQLADKIGRYILSEQTETAYDFLNTSLREELIHDCQNQKSFTTPLSELIVQRKEKYRPFYEKLGRKIPARIYNITAEELCFIMDKELLSHESTIREQGQETLCGQGQVTGQKGDGFGQDHVEEKDKDCEEGNNTKLNAEQFIQQFKKNNTGTDLYCSIHHSCLPAIFSAINPPQTTVAEMSFSNSAQ